MKRFVVFVCVTAVLLGFFCFHPMEALASAAKSRQIFIGGGRSTTPWYPFAQALAKFINDKSNWLKAEAISTAGISGNFDMIKEKPNKYIGLSSFSQIHRRAGHAYGEKRGPYAGDRFIANASSMTQCIITYDPKIKRVHDLAGKIVDVGRKGAANTIDHQAVLKSYGVLDKVKLVYTGYRRGADKLKDGSVDASFLLFNHIYPKTFNKGAFIKKLEPRGPVYYVGFDRKTLLGLTDNEFATLPVRVPAKALDPKTQPKEIWAFNDPTFFIADQSMDDDIVYEVSRVIWETPADEWAKWHPSGIHMTKNFKAAPPSFKLYTIHPGAKKYFDDQGVKLKSLAELLK